MGLKDASPNICQVLGGEKFQHLARVPAPTHTERVTFQHSDHGSIDQILDRNLLPIVGKTVLLRDQSAHVATGVMGQLPAPGRPRDASRPGSAH